MRKNNRIILYGITDFNLRFIYKDNCCQNIKTKRIFFCPNDFHDFDFKLNLNDCSKSKSCKNCWSNYFAMLKERESCI